MNTSPVTTDPQTGIAIGDEVILDREGLPRAEISQIIGRGRFWVIVDDSMRIADQSDIMALVTPAGFVLEDGATVEALR